MGVNKQDSLVCRNDLGWLLGAQDSHSTLVEAMWIFLGGDVEVNGEDEVRPGEVQVNGQSHLWGGGKERKCDADNHLMAS